MNRQTSDHNNSVQALSALTQPQHRSSSSTLLEVLTQPDRLDVAQFGGCVSSYQDAMSKVLNAAAIALVEHGSTLAGMRDNNAPFQEAASCLYQALLENDNLAAMLHLPSCLAFASVDTNMFRHPNFVASNLFPVSSINVGASRSAWQLQVEVNTGPEYDEGMHAFSDLLSISADYVESKNKTTSNADMNNLTQQYSLAAILIYNLGQVRLKQQRWDDAYNCFVDAYMLTELVSSANGARIAVPTLHNMGYIQYRCGNLNRSIQTFTKALSVCQVYLSSSPAHLAATLNCLGVLHFHRTSESNNCLGITSSATTADPNTITSTTEKALQCLLRALSLHRHCASARTLATTLNNLGRVHYVLERADASLQAYQEALRLRCAILGDHHLDVAATFFNMGQTLHQCDSLDAALEHYDAFLRISVPVLGYAHRDVAFMLKCKAQVYQQKGDTDKAVSVYHQALQSCQSALGVHAELASILNKLGNLYYDKGDYATSLDIYSCGLAVERAVFDPLHPNITVTLSNMAQIHRQRGDIVQAFRVYEEVLGLQMTTLGGQHPDVAHTLSSLALLHYQNKKYTMALDYYQKALNIRRDCYGETHLDVAGTLNSLGLVLFKLGQLNMALDSFLQSLSIRRSLLGSSHREVAINLYNVATIHMELGNLDEALRCYKETLRIESLGEGGGNHIDATRTLLYIALVHEQNGEDDLALDHYKKALQLQRETLPHNDPAIGKTLMQIGNFYLQRGGSDGHLGTCMDALSGALRIHEAQGGTVLDFRETKVNMYALAKVHPEAAASA